MEDNKDRVQLCVNCKWFEHWEGVCTNGNSENRAAFMWGNHDTCDKWEEAES